jgi:hypothetical protein
LRQTLRRFIPTLRQANNKSFLDEYVYTADDKLIEGEIEAGKRYTETDFNKIIEIKEREKKRVEIFMDGINQNEKTLVFCERRGGRAQSGKADAATSFEVWLDPRCHH